jgi:hypothetical protein
MTLNHTSHFVLLPDGKVREFSEELAAKIATGAGRMPEFADRRLRYLQITVSAEPQDEDIKIVSAGASICFDHSGRLTEAAPLKVEGDQISPFEHDACVQWALRDVPAAAATRH